MRDRNFFYFLTNMVNGRKYVGHYKQMPWLKYGAFYIGKSLNHDDLNELFQEDNEDDMKMFVYELTRGYDDEGNFYAELNQAECDLVVLICTRILNSTKNGYNLDTDKLVTIEKVGENDVDTLYRMAQGLLGDSDRDFTFLEQRLKQKENRQFGSESYV